MRLAAATALALATLTMPACSIFDDGRVDRQEYADLQVGWTIAVNSAIAAYGSGLISDADWVSVWNPTIQAGDDALDNLNDATISGDVHAQEAARIAFMAAMDKLTARLIADKIKDNP